jgi:hypothetical protein
MSNWYEAWADRYAEWSAGVTADVPFYVALAREADGLLVELAVGNGRSDGSAIATSQARNPLFYTASGPFCFVSRHALHAGGRRFDPVTAHV